MHTHVLVFMVFTIHVKAACIATLSCSTAQTCSQFFFQKKDKKEDKQCLVQPRSPLPLPFLLTP